MSNKASIADVLDSVIGIPAVNEDTNNDKASFIPSEKFIGSKSSYVFRAGDRGVGYYLDVVGGEERVTKRAKLDLNDNNEVKRSVRFDPAKDQTKSIPARTKKTKLSGEELLAQAEEAASQTPNKNFDTSSKSIALFSNALNKTHQKNLLLRARYEHDPEKFMMNELALNDEILQFKNAAVDIISYQYLVEHSVISTFGRLMEHENSDVAMSVVSVLVELLDPHLLQESDDEKQDSSGDEGMNAKVYNIGLLATAFLHESGFDAIANNLGRFDESLEEDARGVEDSLTLIESFLDLDRAGVLNESQSSESKDSVSVVDYICKTTLLSWLLNRVEKNDESDDAANNPISPAVIRLHASEVLSTIIQHEDYSSKKCGVRLANCPKYTSVFDENETTVKANSANANVDGMEILLISISAYRKSDPKVEVECEFLENIFDALAASLMRADNVSDFLEKEGIELMLRCVREKVHSGGGALKVLNFALTGSSAVDEESGDSSSIYKKACEIFIHVGGLKLLFPLYMARKSAIPCPAACSEGGSDLAKKAISSERDVSRRAKRAAHARKKWLVEVERNVVDIMYSLTRYIDKESKYDSYSRLLAKFIADDCVSCSYHFSFIIKSNYFDQYIDYNLQIS